MEIYKTKSTKAGTLDKEVEQGSVISFMSFERAIAENPNYKDHWSNGNVMGYRITSQGIEIFFQSI